MTYTAKRVHGGNLQVRRTDIDYWDLWHDQVKPIDLHEGRHAFDSERWHIAPDEHVNHDEDNNPARHLRGRGHGNDCTCERCVSARLAYECETDIEDTLEARHDRVMSLALSVNPAKASDVLKALHRAYVHYRDLSEAMGIPGEYGTLIILSDTFRANAAYLARTYDKAGRVLWARMMYHARNERQSAAKQTKRAHVEPRSDPGTIGRTTVTDDNLYVCPHPECGCQGIPWSQRKRLIK